MRIAMRATILAPALLLSGILSLITFDAASSLPALSARPAAKSAGLVEEAKTQRYRKVRKYGQRRPYYVPYACSRPYQFRYWQFYPPICYPL
jgi:hypothetical protein